MAALAAPLAAQSEFREFNRIHLEITGGTRTYAYKGTGTHRYATATGTVTEDAPKAGVFEKGVYTCWHPAGWKHVEIAFDRGVKFTTFDADGKPVRSLRSEGLQGSWHPSGRLAFAAAGGGFQFWNEDGSIAADVRLCQDIWNVWGTDVEVDEWRAWCELLHDNHVGTILPSLVAGMDHADPWVRAHACEAIDTFDRHATSAVPALRRALVDDPFWLVRQRAAQALCYLGPLAREAVPELAKVVGNSAEDAATRVLAARALGDIGAAAAVAVPPLELAAETGPPSLQVEAIAALGWIDPADRATVQKLVSRLADPEAALSAATALYYRYRAVAAAARDVVQEELGKQGEQFTDLAMQLSVLLHHIDPSARQPAWTEGMLDSSPPLPRRSLEPEALLAFCMVDADPDEIGDVISAIASCEGQYFRKQLLDVPSQLGPEARAAVPGLVHLLPSYDSATSDWASRALAHIGPDAIPALTAALKPQGTRWWGGTRSALATLAAIGEPATLALVDALDHEDLSLRIETATVLGRIGPAANAAVPALRKLLSAPSDRLRAAAALAIARIEGPAKHSPQSAAPR